MTSLRVVPSYLARAARSFVRSAASREARSGPELPCVNWHSERLVRPVRSRLAFPRHVAMLSRAPGYLVPMRGRCQQWHRGLLCRSDPVRVHLAPRSTGSAMSRGRFRREHTPAQAGEKAGRRLPGPGRERRYLGASSGTCAASHLEQRSRRLHKCGSPTGAARRRPPVRPPPRREDRTR